MFILILSFNFYK